MMHHEAAHLKQRTTAFLTVAHDTSFSSITAWIVEASMSLPR
jgi:hypothetical protein